MNLARILSALVVAGWCVLSTGGLEARHRHHGFGNGHGFHSYHHHGFHSHHHHGHGVLVLRRPLYRSLVVGWGTYPRYGSLAAYGFWDGYGCGYPIAYPPLVLDAGQLYGLRAQANFLGVNLPPPAAGRRPVAEPQIAAPNPPDEPNEPDVVGAGAAASRALAWRFVQFGDQRFRAGEYHQALQRYKKAAARAAAPAEAYFRQAVAHLALGKYGRATEAVRRGLAQNPDWPHADFAWDQLYAEPAEKAAHQQELQQWLAENPFDANAHFMLGVLAHFDGETERAIAAFERTIELTGIGDHARAFLTQQPEAQDAAKLIIP